MFAHKLMPFIVGLGLLVVGCGTTEEQQAPSGTPDPILTAGKLGGHVPLGGGATGFKLLRSEQSACKGHESGPYDGPTNGTTLKATLQAGGALELVHVDVSENCAAKIAATVQVNGSSILMVETITNPQEQADCMCKFDVTAVVAGLAPGTYQVSAQSPEGQLTGPVSITIPPSPLQPSLQSACKKGAGGENGPLGASLKTSLQGSTLTVEHDDVQANCAAKLAMSVTVVAPSAGKPGSIHIVDVVTNPNEQANCFCVYDLSTSISNLASGSYELTATGPDGSVTGPVTIFVP
jgi:hypothetical protein